MLSSDDSSPSDEQEIEQALQEAERSLQTLKERHAQVKADRQRQNELQQRLTDAQRQVKQHRSQRLREEIQQLKQNLAEVEIALESQLFTWGSLKEPFWQAVRFGGLGILIGVALRSCAG